jgi:hypothetical protein
VGRLRPLARTRGPSRLASSKSMSEPREDQPAEPQIGRSLPQASRAHIDLDKLTRYALDPGHPVGRHKARVFKSALAIGQEDAEYLRDEILRELPSCVVTGRRPPQSASERLTWEVQMPITGLNGRELVVITAWEMIGGRPELTTTRVARKRRQTGLD